MSEGKPLGDLNKALNLRRRQAIRRRWKWAGIITGVLVLLGAGVWLGFFSDVLAARTVQVSGTQYCDAAQVESEAQVETGKSLLLLDTAAVEQRVRQMPCVADVEVSRSWPHGVEIAVTEKTPIFQRAEGESFQLVSADGTVFYTSPERVELPLAQTPEPDQGLLAEVATVVQALPVEVSGQLDYLVGSTRDLIVIMLVDGRQITWGSGEQSGFKAQVVVPLLAVPGTRYDVSSPDNPAVLP
jgi:cell division protein FtsQ